MGSCTWWPRRPGTLPCLSLHFRTRLRGAGGSPRVVGVRARCDSAQPGPDQVLPSLMLGAVFKFFRVPSGRVCGERCFPSPLACGLGAGGGMGEGRGQALGFMGLFLPRPFSRAEIVLEASGAQCPALVPGCWGEGRLRGGAPFPRGPGRRMSGKD